MKEKIIADSHNDFQLTRIQGAEIKVKEVFTSLYSFIRCDSGNALISIDSHEYVLEKGFNFILCDSILFKLISYSDDYSFTSCSFSTKFMNEIFARLDNKIISTVISHSALDHCTEHNMNHINTIFNQLCSMHNRTNHLCHVEVLHNIVLNYYYETYDLVSKYPLLKQEYSSNYQKHILELFFELAREHHNKHHKSSFYAMKLNISDRYLHKIVSSAVASTPKEVIDYSVVTTAKRLLLSSILSCQQIADELGFPDQATFGQFFKRKMGMPPTVFRKQYKNI